MASKKTKAAASSADDNLDELFEGINDSKTKKPTGATTRPKGTSSSKTKDDDPLADLESQLASEQAPTSRPHTPRIKEARRSTATPPAADDKSAAPAVRQSTDSARSLKATFTPSATSSELHESEKKGTVEQAQQAQEGSSGSGGGGGWWGGWISTATATANAAMKQAEAAYKEIQQHEEAKKWAEQVKGLKGIDVGTLRTYGESKSCYKFFHRFEASNERVPRADTVQATSSANAPCRRSPISFTPWPRPSRPTSDSSSTSLTTLWATRPLTR